MNEQEYKIKGWVARDSFGRVFLFKSKPIRSNGTWISALDYYSLLRSDFPELTWEDEPIEVEFTIKKI